MNTEEIFLINLLNVELVNFVHTLIHNINLIIEMVSIIRLSHMRICKQKCTFL